MRDDNWNDIYSGRGDVDVRRGLIMPAPPQKNVPRVNRPTCPEHCSGRHETDSVMACPSHKVAAYRVLLHEYSWDDGHYFTTFEPMNGSPVKSTSETPTCRDCGANMVRIWL